MTTARTRRWILRSAAAGTAAAAGACSPIAAFRSDPPQLYTLSPKSTFDTDLPMVDWQLLVEVPTAAAGLDTPRIALRQTETTLDYYADVAWTDRAPEMVQTLMVESFENSGRIISIGRQSLGLRADYRLKTELREFQAEYLAEGLPTVRVRINAKLIRTRTREIFAGETFENIQQSTGTNIDSLILAFDEGLGHVLKDLVKWTLVEGEDAWSSSHETE